MLHGYCRGQEPYDYVVEVLGRYEHYKRHWPARPGAADGVVEASLPAQRRIQSLPSGPDVELTLRNLMIHPDLPDRLFTEHNLRVQRFPSF